MKKRPKTSNPSIDSITVEEKVEVDPVGQRIGKPKKNIVIIDTVWVFPYGNKEWYDTINTEGYNVYLSTRVDTTDLLIDTVPSKNGYKLVIGYNHYYRLQFVKENATWFNLEFNKRDHFQHLLEGTEFWLESNLDVFHNLLYNKCFGKFVIEYDINPRYNYGSVYYIVFDTEGQINYIGTSSSWGGGGPDGHSFITDDHESYVTCYEIYYFASDTSLTLLDYTRLSVKKEYRDSLVRLSHLHGLRQIRDNSFLAVFSFPDEGTLTKNAFLLRNDSTLLAKFQYAGMLEEMDAILLYTRNEEMNESYLYDSHREVLICISQYDSTFVFEFPLASMRKLRADTIDQSKFYLLDFEAFGSYQFFIDSTGYTIYQNTENLK